MGCEMSVDGLILRGEQGPGKRGVPLTGYRPLATGYRLLATGYWLLATGYWPLASSATGPWTWGNTSDFTTTGTALAG